MASSPMIANFYILKLLYPRSAVYRGGRVDDRV